MSYWGYLLRDPETISNNLTMSLQNEEQLIGRPSHEVPKVDPGEYCNAKKVEDKENPDDGSTLTVFKGYCNNKAGFKTDHVGSGRCKYHGGTIGQSNPGAPKHNQNAAKHSLDADPHHYAESLPPEEETFVEQAASTLLDRIAKNHGRDPDFMDEVLAQRVAIKLHMVAEASDYVSNVSGLIQVVQTEHGSHEEKAPLLEEIRRFDNSIIKNLKSLGVLDDPETQKADAVKEWRQYLESGQGQGQGQQNQVIDVESSANSSD